MWRHIAANALTLLIAGLVVLAGLVGIAQRAFVAQGPLEQAICFRVDRGANLRGVTDELQAEGAISSGMLFRVGAQYDGRDRGLRFGSYLVPASASMDEILDIVTRGGASTCGTEIVLRVGVTNTEYQLRELDPVTSRFGEVMTLPLETEALPERYQQIAESGRGHLGTRQLRGATRGGPTGTDRRDAGTAGGDPERRLGIAR